jgi:hypothetical protein
MARKIARYGVAAAGLLSAVVVTLLTVPGSLSLRQSQPASSLRSVLGAPQLSAQLRLFSAGSAPKTGALVMERGTDITDAGGVPKVRYLTNTDGSTEDIHLKVDGEHFASRALFYPEQPGELGRRPHVIQLYATANDLVVDETVLRLDGTRQEHTITAANGAKHVLGYGFNGDIIIRELTINAGQYQYSQPVLGKEERWYDNATHSLAYSNILDPDNKRAITYWDRDHRLLKAITIPYDTLNNGTSTTAYFPGTSNVRMQSIVDTLYNVVRYFRPDGTLDHILELSQGSTIVQYFDATGKVKLLEQNWDRADKTENGKTTATYKISVVTEEDATGKDVRKIFYSSGLISAIDLYNVEIGGIKYGEIDYIFDQASKTVESVHYWIGKADHQIDREEAHKPVDNFTGPAVTAEETTMRVNPAEDEDLVMPDQMDGGYE